jgi:TP901 family phage tail tape measure protein
MSFGGGASLGTAEGRITVDASQAISELGRVGTAMSSLDSKAGAMQGVGNFTQSTVGLAQGMQHVGRVAVGLGASLAAPFIATVGAAMDFEHAMAGVNAVMDVTDAQFQELSGLAQDLGRDTIFTGTQAAQGIETLGRAGIQFEDIMGGAATAATDLAAAGGIEVPRAAEVMAAAMQAFNIEGEESVRVADALAGMANQTLTDINQLGIGLGQVAGVANAAGMGLEETTAFIGLMADNGIRGSDAATSMKNAILALLAPTDTAAAQLADMGVQLLDSERNFIGLAGASQEFFDVWKGSGQTMSEFLKPLEETLGRDAVRTILFGMQALEDQQKGLTTGWDQYLESASQAGAASEFAAARMDSTAGAIERLRGSIGVLAENMGAGLNAAIRAPIEGLTQLINVISQIPGPILSAIATVGTVIGAFTALGGAVLVVGGYLLEAYARFTATGIALSSILGPAAAVAGALAAIGVAVVAYQNNWFGFADAVDAVADALKGVLGIQEDVAQAQKRTPLDWHEDDAEQGAEKWSGVAAQINAVGNSLSRSTIPVLRDLGKWVNTVLVDRVQEAQDVWEDLNKKGIAPLVAGLASASALLEGTAIGDKLGEIARNVEVFGNVFDIFRNAPAISGMSDLTQILFGLGNAFTAVGMEDVGQAIADLGGMVETATRAYQELRGEGINPVTSALYALATATDKMGWDGLTDQIVRAAEATEEFGRILQHNRSVYESSLGLSGLSATIMATADALRAVTGIDITGWAREATDAIEAMNNAFMKATQEGATPLEAALAGIDAALDTILTPEQQATLDGWSQNWQNLTNAVSDFAGAGLDRVVQFFNELGTAVSSGDMSGALEAVRSLFTDIQAELGAMAGRAIDWAINIGEPALTGWIKDNAGKLGEWVKGKLGDLGGLAGETLGKVEGWLIDVGLPELQGSFEQIADFINGKLQGAVATLQQTKAELGEWIVDVGLPNLQGALEQVGDFIHGKLEGAIATIQQTTVPMREWFVDVALPTLQGSLEQVGDFLHGKLEGAIATLQQTTVTMGEWIVDVGLPTLTGSLEQVGDFISGKIQGAVATVPQISEDFGDWVVNVTGSESNILLESVSFPSLVGGAIVKAITSALDTLSGPALTHEFQANVSQVSGNLGIAIGEFLTGVVVTAVTNLPSIGEGFLAANVTVANAVLSFVGGMFQGVFDSIGDAMDMATIQGPSAAGPTGSGSTIGQELADAITDMLDAAFGNIGTALEGFEPPDINIPDLFAGILTGIQDQITAFLDEVQQISTNAQADMQAAADEIKKLPQTFMDALTGTAPSVPTGEASALGKTSITPVTKAMEAGAVETATQAGVDIPAAAGTALGLMLASNPMTSGLVRAVQGTPGVDAAEVVEPLFGTFRNNIPTAVEGEMQQVGDVLIDSTVKAGGLLSVGDAIDTAVGGSITDTSMDQTTSAVGSKVNEAVGDGVSQIGAQGEQAAGQAGAAAGSIGAALDQVMSSSIQGVTLTAFSQAVGSKIGEAIGQGLAGGDASAQPGLSAGVGGAEGIGNTIANSLATSITGADFAQVGSAIQMKISEAISLGMSAEAAPAGGGAVGGGAGIGAAVALSLANAITTADFAMVGSAISLKISEAVSLGMAQGGATMQAGLGGTGGGGGIGSSIAASIAADIQSADFSAAGAAIAQQIGAGMGQATGQIQSALQAVIQAVVASGQQATQGAQAIGQNITTQIGAGIGQGAGTITAAVAAAVQVGVQAGIAPAAGATAIGTAITTNAGAGVGQGTGTLTAAVGAMVQAGISAGTSAAAGATEIGAQIATQAGAGIGQGTGTLTSAVQAMVQAAIDAGVGAAAGASAIGAAISSGAASGVILDALVGPVTEMVNAGIAAGMAAAGAASPSKKMMQLGEWMSEGLAIGVENKKNESVGAVTKTVQDMLGAVKDGTTISQQLQTLGSELGSIRGMDEFGSAVESLAGEMEAANQDIGTNVKDLIKGIRDRLKQGAKGVGRDAQGIGDAISSGASSGAGTASAATSGTKPEKPNKDAIKDAKDLIVQIKNMQYNIDQLRTLGEELGSIRGMDEFSSNIIGIADSMESEKESAVESAISLKNGLKSEFRTQMKEYREETRKIGKAVADGITEGIASGTSAATEAATGLGEDVAGGLNANLSRLPEMGEAMGEGIGTGVSDGMNSTIPAVQGSGEAVGQALDTGLQSGASGVDNTATDLVTDTTGAMSDAAQGQSDFARTIGELISTTFGEGFASGAKPQAGTQMVSDFGQGIRDAVNAMLPSVQQGGTQIGNALTTGVDQINPTQSGRNLVGEVGTGISSGAAPTTKAAGDAGTDIGQSLTSGVEAACGAANNAASDLTESCIPQGINSGLKDATGVAQNAGQDVSKSLMSGLDISKKDVEKNFGNAGTGFTKSMAQGIGSSAGEATQKAKDVANAAGQVNGSSQGQSVGKSIGQGIAQGVTSTIPEIKAAVEKAVQEGIDAAKSKSESKSPSRVFARIGADMSLGLAMGINDTLAPIAEAAGNMVDTASGILSGSGFTDAEKAMVTSLTSYTDAFGSALKLAAKEITDPKLMNQLDKMGTSGTRKVGTTTTDKSNDGGFNLTINGFQINPNTPEGRALVDMAQILRQTTGQYANR